MKVLLISANSESINMVPLPLGLNCVAVATRNAGHQVELLDLMGSADHDMLVSSVIKRMLPDVIGISIRNIDNQVMSETRFLLNPVTDIISTCRAYSDVPIVLGGAGFSIFPEPALRYLGADIGVCGEGEVAFPLLLDALERGDDISGIDGICLPGRAVQDSCIKRPPLKNLPLPDPALWPVADGVGQDIWIPFQTRRGCVMKCSYCSTPALEGTSIRMHPVDEVVEGITRHVAAGFNRFYFVDNTFNLPNDYAKALCDALIDANLNIQWRGILYPGFLDRELVRKMAESGCVEVSLGFESGSEMVLRRLNKKFTTAQVREASELLTEFGIRRMGFLLLGAPGETRESVMESLAFADSLKRDLLKLTVGIRIYPGTLLEKVAREEDLIAEEDDLLLPKFYLAKGLEGWLDPTIRTWMAERPFCTM